MRKMLLLTTLCLILSYITVSADDLSEIEISEITGNYISDNGTVCITEDGYIYTTSAYSSEVFQVYALGSEEDFVLCPTDYPGAVYFHKSGSEEYEVYNDFKGMINEKTPDEYDVVIGDYIFNSDHTLWTKTNQDASEKPQASSQNQEIKNVVSGFMEGLKTFDYDRMMNTFALEEFVKNLNPAASVERLGAIVPNNIWLPNDTETAIQYNLSNRKYKIRFDLNNLYLAAIKNQMDSMTVRYTPDEYESVNELYDQLFPERNTDPVIEWDGSISDPDAFTGGRYSSEMNTKNRIQQAAYAGVDEVESIVIPLSINGEKACIFMDVCRYDENWYILNLNGNAGAIAGVSTLTGGLIYMNDFNNLN